LIEHVLRYQKLGWFLFPVYGMNGDTCACGKKNCSSPAKHPIPNDGLNAATNDEQVLRDWWAAYPDASIGLVLKASNLIALDVDNYIEKEITDLERLEVLSKTLGDLPETVVNVSGSGEGYHFIFKSPPFPVRGVIGGVVVRSNAYIILPPSAHKSGGQYKFEVSPDEAEIAELPELWQEALRKTATVGTVGVPDDEPEWLAEIPDEQRIADMRTHLEREEGEIKGKSSPGTTFNVIRSAIRRHGVRDQEAALLAAQEIYDVKCVPPWGDRLGRHVWTAYERATNPAWGEHYRPDSDRLDELGFDTTSTPITKIERNVSQDELVAALKVAKDRLGRAANTKKKLASTYLSRVLKGERLTQKVDEEVEALKLTLRTLAEHSPSDTSARAIAEVLAHSCPTLSTDQLIGMVSKFRTAIPPKDAVQQSELPPPCDDEELRGQLIGAREEGSVKSCGSNIERILRYSTELRDNIRFNELTKDIEIWGGRFQETPKGVLDVAIMNWLGEKWALFVSDKDVGAQLGLVARVVGTYNPVAEYLRGVKWDGVSRIDTWLADYCGADDTTYNRRIGAMWMISAAARGLQPGSKVDSVLVLEGIQGTKKSSCFAMLAGAWFSGTPLVLGNKDSYQITTSTWIIELAELSSLRAGEIEAHKAFLTSAEDKFRPPYGKVPETFLRHCVFGGTTNEHEYLQDPTGNRRYWACRVQGTIDIDGLREDRDQLWAEATFRYLSAELNPDRADPSSCPGERWWFTPQEADEAAKIINERRAEDPYVSMIKAWASRRAAPGPGINPARHRFTFVDCAKNALELDPSEMQRQSKQITRALRAAGFERIVVDETDFWQKAGTVVHEAQSVAPEPQGEPQVEAPEPPTTPDTN
jgi:predicted P-loop ATPase